MYYSPICSILCWYTKTYLMLLDHWLKWIMKSFSKLLSQVQRRNVASSNSLLALKVALENTILFLSCQIDHVKSNHQYCHLLIRTPSAWPSICWRKLCFGVRRKEPFIFIHDMVSHRIGSILLQWKNKWNAPSSLFLQKGQNISITCTCLLCRFCLVGSLSLSSLHAKTAILLGIFILHNSSKQSSVDTQKPI